jgi:hypothetical protein
MLCSQHIYPIDEEPSNKDYYLCDEYISNSYLKKFSGKGSFVDPSKLQKIFDVGTLFHTRVLEPAKTGALLTSGVLSVTEDEVRLTVRMAETALSDPLLSALLSGAISAVDIEEEFYREMNGIRVKCKCDGIVKSEGVIIELKSLSVRTYNAFLGSIDRFDYDAGAAYYLDITGAKEVLLFAVSKLCPERYFKTVITRDSTLYHSGRMKYHTYMKNAYMDGGIQDKHIINKTSFKEYFI